MSDLSKGFDLFDDVLKEALDKVDNAMDSIEAGVEEFVKDVRRLPKPRSAINAPGYTHLLDSVNYERGNKSIIVGWGKWYGPITESKRPHLRSTYDNNKNKYLKIIRTNVGF